MKPSDPKPKSERFFIGMDIELVPGPLVTKGEDMIKQNIIGAIKRIGMNPLHVVVSKLSDRDSKEEAGRVYIRLNADDDDYSSREDLRNGIREGIDRLRETTHPTNVVVSLPPPKQPSWTVEEL